MSGAQKLKFGDLTGYPQVVGLLIELLKQCKDKFVHICNFKTNYKWTFQHCPLKAI
jgi:hypothetical protein